MSYIIIKMQCGGGGERSDGDQSTGLSYLSDLFALQHSWPQQCSQSHPKQEHPLLH